MRQVGGSCECVYCLRLCAHLNSNSRGECVHCLCLCAHSTALVILQGVVMPPRVAPQQVVVIPIPNTKLTEDAKQVETAMQHHTLTQLQTYGAISNSYVLRLACNMMHLYTMQHLSHNCELL